MKKKMKKNIGKFNLFIYLKIYNFYNLVSVISPIFSKRKRAFPALSSGPIPIDSILPAKAASIPASASSTTAQSSGFTPNSFAANKKNANYFLLINCSYINNRFS